MSQLFYQICINVVGRKLNIEQPVCECFHGLGAKN